MLRRLEEAWSQRTNPAAEAMKALTGTCFAISEQNKKGLVQGQPPAATRAREVLEENMRKLFNLHDLQGCGTVSSEDLVQLNKRIASLHYGPGIDQEALRKKYEALFYQHLDPSGRPIPYSVFRDYMGFVLHEHDDDIIAQTMILEQFIVEAESALAIFPLDVSPTASTAADDTSLCFELDEDCAGTGICKAEVPSGAAAESSPSEVSEPPPTNHVEPREAVPEEYLHGGTEEEMTGAGPSRQQPKTPVMAVKRPVMELPPWQSNAGSTCTSFDRPPSVRPVRLQASERFRPAAPNGSQGSLSIPPCSAAAKHVWKAQTVQTPRGAPGEQVRSLAAAYGMRPSQQAVLNAGQHTGAPWEALGPGGAVVQTEALCR
mmetsp:Transcript_2951/g.7518  ORF Transcript_2951/g.7518 Transcript_2951/m.7518 type:complete len:375 (-) Transcript_2951:27-1151(-)